MPEQYISPSREIGPSCTISRSFVAWPNTEQASHFCPHCPCTCCNPWLHLASVWALVYLWFSSQYPPYIHCVWWNTKLLDACHENLLPSADNNLIPLCRISFLDRIWYMLPVNSKSATCTSTLLIKMRKQNGRCIKKNYTYKWWLQFLYLSINCIHKS